MADEQEARNPLDEPVVVYVTNDVTIAEIVKNALIAEDIPAEVDSQTQGGLVELVDVRVFVHAEDAERAKTLIEETETAQRQDDRPEEDD
jgi:hypothetical protein